MRVSKRTGKSTPRSFGAWHAPAGDPHATPWDELPREWARKDRYFWALRKTCRREKLLGTW